jgi:lipoprotein NlpI
VQRFLFAVLFLLACSADAVAAGYDDFARGTTANNQHDSDMAITALTAALSAGDLNPNLQPTAHYERAIAYMRKERCDLAKADADAALQAKPDYLNALLLRADANACLVYSEAAIADYSAALAQRDVAGAHFGRAIVLWQQSRFKDAAVDLVEAAKLAPKYPYGAIWLAIALPRADPSNVGAAKEALERVDDEDWPAPIVALYRGKAKPADVDAAASQGEAWTLPGQKCDADFYIGEWQLLLGDKAAAKLRLSSAASSCTKSMGRAVAIFERDHEQ